MKTTNKNRSRLKLNKQTVTELNQSQLNAIYAGVYVPDLTKTLSTCACKTRTAE